MQPSLAFEHLVSMKKNSCILLLLLGMFHPSHACFMLFSSDGKHILVGNHEDWVARDGAVKINTPTAKRYGSVIFTFMSEGWAQGGINEKGLFFDAARTPYHEIYFDNTKKKFDGYFWQMVLDKAATVKEALALINQYELPELNETSVLLADASGMAVVVGGHQHQLDTYTSKGTYLMQTNYNHWHPELSEGTCWRYQKAEQLLAATPITSVDAIKNILEITHQDSLTAYSNVYDLTNLTVYTYNKRNFKQPIVISLPAYFAYGDCLLSLDALEQNPTHWDTCRKQANSKIISGKIIDQHGEPIPYVNIGVFQKNIGTLSDPDGTFELSLPASAEHDSLLFSSLGFEQVSMPTKNLIGCKDLIIRLKSQHILLKEVLISEKKVRKKVARLGWMGGKDGILPFDTLQGGGAVALLVESPEASFLVEKLQVRLMYNSKDTLKLRLHFYTFDSLHQQPGEELLTREIILQEYKRFGWLRFDLEKYNIAMYNQKRFCIGFEWIDDRITRTQMLSGLRNWEQWKKEEYDKQNPNVSYLPSDATQKGSYKYNGNMMNWPGFKDLPPFTGLMIETGKTAQTQSLRTFERKTSFGQWTEIPSTLNAVVTIAY